MLEHTVNAEAETFNKVIDEVSKVVHVKINTEIANFQF